MNKVTESWNFYGIAKILMHAFIQANKEELDGREGVYLAVLHKTANKEAMEKQVETILIGKMSKEKQAEKRTYAIEKVCRLFMLNNSNKDGIHRSSFQSEDALNKMFGGGIMIDDCYIAVSGFPPHLDQKFVTLFALMTNRMSFYDAYYIDMLTLEKQQKWMKK